MRAARWQREGPANRRAQQAPAWVEHVEQPVEVVLVGASSMEEDECALRLPRRLADERAQLGQRTLQLSRGFGSGVSTGSI